MNGAGGATDCTNYINKLAYFGSNYSPGKLIISASAGGYGDTNWYFDDTNPQLFLPYFFLGVAGVTNVSANAFVTYTNVTSAPSIGTLAGHITSAINVAGFASWGVHGYYGNTNQGYATNSTIQFSGQSGWYVIETGESFNGQQSTWTGNFLEWYASNAFGGTGYSNTPVGAISNVEEPNSAGNDPFAYFGNWAAGRNFACCAWNSYFFPVGIQNVLQVIGDPFTKK
jgi:hypothetical protein